MNIKVKLNAGLKQYIPSSAELACKEEWEVAEWTTIRDVLQRLNLPDSLNIATLVNGVHCREKETMLRR